MTMTLGEALTAKNQDAIDVRNPDIDQGIDKAKKKVAKRRRKFKSGALDGALKKAVMTALDITLDDIVGQAWSTLKELHKYADPAQTPPDDVNVVTLGKHRIESLHKPSVDVVVGDDTVVHSFTFDVTVNLNIEGANVEVQQGKIQAIRLTKLKLGGSINLNERPILEKQIGEISIPGEMRLKDPIQINPGNA